MKEEEKRRKEKVMKLNTSIRKRFRVSNKVKKVASKDRFRLSISRSSKNISAQIIDDTKKITLLSASSYMFARVSSNDNL